MRPSHNVVEKIQVEDILISLTSNFLASFLLWISPRWANMSAHHNQHLIIGGAMHFVFWPSCISSACLLLCWSLIGWK